jgi:hypothetical protein
MSGVCIIHPPKKLILPRSKSTRRISQKFAAGCCAVRYLSGLPADSGHGQYLFAFQTLNPLFEVVYCKRRRISNPVTAVLTILGNNETAIVPGLYAIWGLVTSFARLSCYLLTLIEQKTRRPRGGNPGAFQLPGI